MHRLWQYRYTWLFIALGVAATAYDSTLVIRHTVDWNRHWPFFIPVAMAAFAMMTWKMEKA